MKMFRTIPIKMDDDTVAALQTIVDAEKRGNPSHMVSRGSVVRELIHRRARQLVSRETRPSIRE